eukprot:1061519-Pelagomonas_calceolata.AAC.10
MQPDMCQLPCAQASEKEAGMIQIDAISGTALRGCGMEPLHVKRIDWPAPNHATTKVVAQPSALGPCTAERCKLACVHSMLWQGVA